MTHQGSYTTRRHPRTLAEAWQHPPARQSTLMGPYRRREPIRWGRWLYLGVLVLSVAACGMLVTA